MDWLLVPKKLVRIDVGMRLPKVLMPQADCAPIHALRQYVAAAWNCKALLDTGPHNGDTGRVIRSFQHKGLAELFHSGRSAKVHASLHARVLRRLDTLDAADELAAVNVPGFDFHALRGFKPRRYSLHVNGPWCITFEWNAGDATHVDLVQYH